MNTSTQSPTKSMLSLDEKGQAAIARISSVLGSESTSESVDVNDLLVKASERMDQAARLMDQLQSLREVAVRQGFVGTSASQMIKFSQDQLEQGSKSQAIAQLAKACESLDPDLAFDAAHTDGTNALLGACLRTIKESAARLQAQETTIVSLVGSLREAPGGWQPDRLREGQRKPGPSGP